ncbi:hypothetical protein OBK13_03090 [Empedobacter falsenii]
MIKKIVFISVFSLLPGVIFSQVGINTKTPSATLDIVTKDKLATTEALKAINNTNKFFKIYNNGNVNFNNLLYLNSNQGNVDYVLTSQGSNTAPIWTDILKSTLSNYVVIGYNGSKETQTANETFSAEESTAISFKGTTNISSTDIGEWNTAYNVYTVKKSGIYEIIVHLKSHTTTNQENRSGMMMIHMGVFKQLFKGSNIVENRFTTNFTGKVSRYLETGTQIKVSSYLSSKWRYDFASININYSPKTSN